MNCDCLSPDAGGETKIVKARKSHRCCECGFPISAGDRYQRMDGIWEGEALSFTTCLNCAEVRSRLEKENDCCIEIGGLVDFIFESNYIEEEPVRHGLSCAIGVMVPWLRRSNGRFEVVA